MEGANIGVARVHVPWLVARVCPCCCRDHGDYGSEAGVDEEMAVMGEIAMKTEVMEVLMTRPMWKMGGLESRGGETGSQA